MLLMLYRSVVDAYVSTERCAPSTLLLVSRREPALADCILAKERRATSPTARRARGNVALKLVTTQLIDRFAVACCVESVLTLKTMPFFYLKIF